MITITVEVRDRIDQLAQRHDGHLTPDHVWQDAQSASSPLHSLFNWNVNEAAIEHWRARARSIIRAVRVEVIEDTVATRIIAYVRDPEVRSDEQGYVSTLKLRNDYSLAREALLYELQRAHSALERAKLVAVALGMEGELEVLLRGVSRVRQRAETQHEGAAGVA